VGGAGFECALDAGACLVKRRVGNALMESSLTPIFEEKHFNKRQSSAKGVNLLSSERDSAIFVEVQRACDAR